MERETKKAKLEIFQFVRKLANLIKLAKIVPSMEIQ